MRRRGETLPLDYNFQKTTAADPSTLSPFETKTRNQKKERAKIMKQLTLQRSNRGNTLLVKREKRNMNFI